MTLVSSELSTTELMKLAADNHHKRITLSEAERLELIALLKRRGAEELEYGQELAVDTVTMIRRVTGAVGIYFGTG
jgi:hypothetical protein